MDFGFEDLDSGFSAFDVDVEEIVVKKTKTYDRVWKTSPGGSIDNNPLMHEGVIYFGACDGQVYAVDAGSGKVIWTFRTNDSIVGSSPALFDNSIIIGSYDGNLYRIDLEKRDAVWVFKTSGKIFSSPFVYGKNAYFGSMDGNVYAVSCETGKEELAVQDGRGDSVITTG